MDQNQTEAEVVKPSLDELLEMGYTTKDALQEITISPEELKTQRIDNVMQNLLSSMTGVASKNGQKVYIAQMDYEFDKKVLAAVKVNLEVLGFELKHDTETSETHQFLSISWE